MAKPRKYALTDWPAPDRAAWEAATSTEVSFFARGKFVAWASETKRQAFYAYSRWLTFLAEGYPETLQAAPQERLTPARLEEFVARVEQQGANAQSVVSILTHLINAVHAVAPAYKTRALRQVQKHHGRRITPRDKRSRMQPPPAVFQLGLELMDQAATIADPREAARTFRDGLIIAIWILRAPRRTTLTALAVDTLIRNGAHYRLVVDAKHVKSRKRIDQPLPPELTPYIEGYLNNYRLRFPRAKEHAALWPSSKGGAMCKEAIWDAVRRRTRVKFGRAINLHLARDIVATSKPDLGSALLDHSKPTMTDLHYRRSDPLAASRKLGAVIAALRANAAAAKTSARRRGSTDARSPTQPASERTEEAIV